MSKKQTGKTLRIPTAPVFRPLIKKARYKGLWGGRGSGKSHFFAEALVEQCLMEPTRAVCIREIQNSLRQSVKLLVEDKIRALGVAEHFHVMNDKILAPNDGVIIFTGMQNHTAESIKSLEGFNIAWFEEAQSMSQFSLSLLRPTIRVAGSEMWFSWNPRTEDDPIDVFLRSDDPPEDSIVVNANYRHNPWFPAVLRAEMEYDKRRDPDRYNHVWLGAYQKASQARVFRNWKVEEFETPPNARFYFGADWGFSVDPTVLIRCFIEGKKLFVDYEAWAVGCELDHTPALFAGTDKRNPPRWANPKGYKGIDGSTEWPLRADSSNPQSISYMRRHGFNNIVPSIKGVGSVEEGIEFLKTYDIVVHPRCEHVIDELSSYSYKVDKRTEEVIPVLEDAHNHTIDSLRYAVEAERRFVPRPVFSTYGVTV